MELVTVGAIANIMSTAQGEEANRRVWKELMGGAFDESGYMYVHNHPPIRGSVD